MTKIRRVRRREVRRDPIEIPEVDEDFKRIIEVRRNIDPKTEWTTIRNWIEEQPRTIQELRDAIRIAAHMTARATDLLHVTKIQRDKFRIKHTARIQLWRSEALLYWEAEKEAGMRKQITEQMIEDRIIDQWEELYTELQTRLNEINTLYDSFKSLVSLVENKEIDLRKLLESEGKKPGYVPNWFGDKSNG